VPFLTLLLSALIFSSPIVGQQELDYRRRIALYKTFYEPLDLDSVDPVESKWSYIKCNHGQQNFVVHRVTGSLPQTVANFIMNMRTEKHAFYLTRHGQSEYNALRRIGGDSGLTEDGRRYARALAEFVNTNVTRDAESGADVPARLWTSTMRRTKETAEFLPQSKILVTRSDEDPQLPHEWFQMRARSWHHLDELYAGAFDGMTYEEIASQHPDEWQRRQADKLVYRYPRGESYLDVIARLEPIIIEMERHQEPLLIIAHQGVLRIIYAFYMGLSRAEV
jgi:broad specificity phosphatase PhoE